MLNVFFILVHLFNIFFIVLFFLLFDVASLFQVLGGITVLASLLLATKLVVNVLHLALHLLVRGSHEVGKHVHHAESVGLLLQTLPREDGVERSIDMGANLKVVMLHHIGEDLQNIDLGSELLTLILTSIPQRKIHQQGRGILHRIVRQVILAVLEDLDYPGNHAALNHVGLSAFAKTELLERAQGVLAEV